MFFVHLSCWKMARQNGGQVPGESLYKLAENTRPIIDWRYLIDKVPQPPLGFPRAEEVQANTSLGAFMRHSPTHLPEELQQEILSYLRGTLIFSLLSTLQTISVLRQIHPRPPSGWISRCLAGTVTETDALRGETVRIFGQTYLRQLEVAKDGDALPLSILIKNQCVRGLKYVLGTYGVCAVRVLYDDGSSSPWLGSPSEGWNARVYGSDLGRLCVVQDVSPGNPLVGRDSANDTGSESASCTLCRRCPIKMARPSSVA